MVKNADFLKPDVCLSNSPKTKHNEFNAKHRKILLIKKQKLSNISSCLPKNVIED